MTDRILLDHGSGGEKMQQLIRDVFFSKLDNEYLNKQDDAAILPDQIAFTTDSFVVSPAFFPGGDIGKLAVCGTVNDLAVSGAKPLYLSSAFIIEEGFLLHDLERIVDSMANEANKAGVKIVAGDTKVVRRGDADGIFITTSGIGKIIANLNSENINLGDAIVVNGTMGEHGLAIMAKREGIRLETDMISDCASLNSMIEDVLNSGIDVKFMRDATRGGMSAVLNEMVLNKNWSAVVKESEVPVSNEARVISELLGLDILQIACEGRAVFVVASKDKERLIQVLKKHKEGVGSKEIGIIDNEFKEKVILIVPGGGKRVMSMPSGENLPRIC